MTATMNPNLKDFWSKPSRFKVLYGGRASGKTWDAAARMVYLSQACTLRILCARQFQSKIQESVYREIIIQIERFGLTHEYDIQKNTIIHKRTGSEFLFYGIARNINEMKGLADIDILWLEEAEAISEESYKIIEPTIRKEGSEILIVFNPRYATDFVYSHFVSNTPPNTQIRHINYTENPFLSRTALDDIDAIKERDFADYQHRYLGVPLSDSDRVIIQRRWLEAAIDAHKKLGIEPSGQKRIGYDVADDGADLCATVSAYGILATDLDEWKAGPDELVESAYRVADRAHREGAEVYYDAIGVGAGVGSNIKQYNAINSRRVKYHAWNASGGKINPEKEYKDGVLNKDQFSNAKSQAWWVVADRLIETYNAVTKGAKFDPNNIISIASDIPDREKLFSELSAPWRDSDATGKSKVEKKDDMKKRGIASPNKADAFIMAFAPQEKGFGGWAGAL